MPYRSLKLEEPILMWCHLLLAMPVFGLGLFLVLPWQWAAAGYLVVVAASALVYWKIVKAMRLPVVTGPEVLAGKRGRVVASNDDAFAPYLVRVSGELWSATADHELAPGEEVTVIATRGNRITVCRVQGRSTLTPHA